MKLFEIKVGSEHLGSIPTCNKTNFSSWLAALNTTVQSDGHLRVIYNEKFDKTARIAEVETLTPPEPSDYKTFLPAPPSPKRKQPPALPHTNEEIVEAMKQAELTDKQNAKMFDAKFRPLKVDNELKAAIAASSTEELRGAVRHIHEDPKKSAYEVVQAMTTIYQVDSIPARASTLKELQNLRMKGLDFNKFRADFLTTARKYRLQGGNLAPRTAYLLSKEGLVASMGTALQGQFRYTLTGVIANIEIQADCREVLLPGEDELTPEPRWLLTRLLHIGNFFEQLADSDRAALDSERLAGIEDSTTINVKNELKALRGQLAALKAGRAAAISRNSTTPATRKCWNCQGEGHSQDTCPSARCGYCRTTTAPPHKSRSCPKRIADKAAKGLKVRAPKASA